MLIGAASFEAGASEGVAFVLDLTERKQAEASARASGATADAAQLAHANRIATMGQLTASIAHEVNQPIAATVTNALAALRWLGAEPPNLNEIQQALDRIVRDSNRAAPSSAGSAISSRRRRQATSAWTSMQRSAR